MIYTVGIVAITLFLTGCNNGAKEITTIEDEESITGNEQQVLNVSGTKGIAHNNPIEFETQPVPSTTGEQSGKSTLTAYQKYILFEAGTEPPFHNTYRNFHGTGIYVDIVDGTPLFSSLDKFDSGTGRPSFTKPITQTAVTENEDTSLSITRTEVISTSSKGHLGHVFNDGPQEFGWLRYCINSAALRFVPLEEMKAQWYEKYIVLFKEDK